MADGSRQHDLWSLQLAALLARTALGLAKPSDSVGTDLVGDEVERG